MPRSLAASTSIQSVPTLVVVINLSFGRLFICSLETISNPDGLATNISASPAFSASSFGVILETIIVTTSFCPLASRAFCIRLLNSFVAPMIYIFIRGIDDIKSIFFFY